MSQLEVIIGPMFAGKSTELIRRIRRYTLKNNKIIIVGNIIDIRSGNCILTHNNEMLDVIVVSKLSDIFKMQNYETTNIIAFDEAQFFPDLIESVKIMLKDNKHILCSGLNGTFKRTPFENISELISLATNITFLTAICTHKNCHKDAPYTTKMNTLCVINNIETGGLEMYEPRCSEHYEEFE